MKPKPRLTLIPTSGQALERVTIDSTAPVSIGRSSLCQVQLPAESRFVSRLHATIAYGGGAWLVTDESRRGTFVRGEKLTPGEPRTLFDGDSVRFGECEFAAQTGDPEADSLGAERTFELSSRAVELTALGAERMLESVLALPARLALASEERGTYSAACEHLVGALTPAIATAYVTVACAGEGVQMLGHAGLPDERGLRSELLEPTTSRRVVQRLLAAPESVLFMQRDQRGATQNGVQHALAASLLERGAAGRHAIMYAVGDVALLRAEQLVAQYLRLVSKLVRQHVSTLRRSHLARCFAPQLLELLGQRDGMAALSGEPRVAVATSLFLDLRCSSLPLAAAPEELSELYSDLRRALSIASESVFAAGGTLIDYAGGAVLAVWGAPFAREDHADCAVACALEIVRRLNGATFPALGCDGPPCGIGIATGEVLAGAVGSSIVFKYGVFGPSVNAAAQLATLARPRLLGRSILMTQAVRGQLTKCADYVQRVAELDLPGLGSGVEVHEARLDAREPAHHETHSRS